MPIPDLSSRILAVSALETPSRKSPTHRSDSNGYSLIEIFVVVIIVGIFTVLVIPRFLRAADTAPQDQLRENLSIFRTAITVYRAEHNGVPPGYRDGNTSEFPTYETFVNQLTQYTNPSGEPSSVRGGEFKYGPYLESVPANPINRNPDVRLVISKDQFPSGPDGTTGWLYQPSSGTLVPNVVGTDTEGIKFFLY